MLIVAQLPNYFHTFFWNPEGSLNPAHEIKPRDLTLSQVNPAQIHTAHFLSHPF
jgi:hypothetical protein